MTLDWSYTTSTAVKGTYRRRIKDIDDAFRAFGATEKGSPAEFLVHYFACEKLAKAIVGIGEEEPAESMDAVGMYNPLRIAAAARKLKLTFPDCEALFGTVGSTAPVPKTARVIRNRVFHNFGPTNVGHAARGSQTFMPMMREFLRLRPAIQRHLERLNETRSIAPPPPKMIKVRPSR